MDTALVPRYRVAFTNLNTYIMYIDEVYNVIPIVNQVNKLSLVD